MSQTTIGLIGLAFLFIFLILRMPVAIAMLVVGFVGTWGMNGTTPALISLSGEAFEIVSFFELSVVPLFVLFVKMLRFKMCIPMPKMIVDKVLMLGESEKLLI